MTRLYDTYFGKQGPDKALVQPPRQPLEAIAGETDLSKIIATQATRIAALEAIVASYEARDMARKAKQSARVKAFRAQPDQE